MCVWEREGNCRLVWVLGIVVITKVFISTESWFLGNGLQYSWGQKRGKSRRQGAFKKATLFTRKTTIFGKLFLAFPLSHFFKCVSDSNYFDFVLERRCCCCYNFGFKWSSPGFRFLVACSIQLRSYAPYLNSNSQYTRTYNTLKQYETNVEGKQATPQWSFMKSE